MASKTSEKVTLFLRALKLERGRVHCKLRTLYRKGRDQAKSGRLLGSSQKLIISQRNFEKSTSQGANMERMTKGSLVVSSRAVSGHFCIGKIGVVHLPGPKKLWI